MRQPAHGPSNGTMGSMWIAEWCDGCAHEHTTSHVPESEADYSAGCPHLADLYIEDGPFDFLRDEHDDSEQGWSPAKLVCLHFERCGRCDPGGGPDGPPPVHPDQGSLFDVLPDSPTTPGGMVVAVPDPVPVA